MFARSGEEKRLYDSEIENCCINFCYAILDCEQRGPSILNRLHQWEVWKVKIGDALPRLPSFQLNLFTVR